MKNIQSPFMGNFNRFTMSLVLICTTFACEIQEDQFYPLSDQTLDELRKDQKISTDDQMLQATQDQKISADLGGQNADQSIDPNLDMSILDLNMAGDMATSCVCPENYAPVCGVDGITYPNECFAQCANVRIERTGECTVVNQCPQCSVPICGPNEILNYHAGEVDAQGCQVCPSCDPVMTMCRDDQQCAIGQICVNGVCQDQASCLCERIYAPVCGVDGMTYSNQCEADCVNVAVASQGPCNQGCPPVLCDLFCEFGFKVDANGCEICECNRQIQVDCSMPPYNAQDLRYVGHSVEECQLIRYACDLDEVGFSNECGCGCQAAFSCAPGFIMFQGECLTQCLGDDQCGRGEYCNVVDVCLSNCLPGRICPDVCYGVCVPRF
jgi:hypothetical protein